MEKAGLTEGNSNVSISAVLSTIAGIVMVLGGITAISMFAWYPSMFGGVFMMNKGMMHMEGISSIWPSMVMPSGSILGSLIALSSLSIAAGIMSIIGGYKLYKEPEKSKNWALVILAASIIGLFGMAGFGIGAILGIIAGIIGIMAKR